LSPELKSVAGSIPGKSALVTGGSRGIGFAIASALQREGAHVTMVARDRAQLARAAQHISAQSRVVDVADAEAVQRLAAELPGTPDILVNSAGAFELAPLAETSIESFDRQIAVNLRGVFLLVRTFLPEMLARGSGHIVTIGSVAGRQAFPANGAYSASKFGVRGLHAVLQEELRGTGVRATLIEPAATDTELWMPIDRDRYTTLPETQSMLSPAAVAQAVLYALNQAPDVTVANVIVQRG
jgi:NADP-dependent 3-hydroxy acid dehydrogenase YdfG